MANTAIIYTIGQTHRIYINVTPEEAARRWQLVRDGMSDSELLLEAKHGYKVVRNAFEFTDEIEIWGNAAQEFQEVADMLLGRLSGQ
jgi:hypothetical protein